MAEILITIQQALPVARSFNLAFNNAFMYGGNHQTTKDSAASFHENLQQMLGILPIVTLCVEKNSVYLEQHCVDKWVSVPRINARFTKAGVQSVSFDKDASLANVQVFFYLMGSLADFPTVGAMQEYLQQRCIAGVKINYVVYKKVTNDESVVNKEILSEAQLRGTPSPAGTGADSHLDPDRVLRDLSALLSLSNAADPFPALNVTTPGASQVSAADYDASIAAQMRSLRDQLNAPASATDETPLSSTEMLESIYKLKENVLEQIKLQRETGKLAAAEELVISEINQMSYQVIVRLIKEEYRADRTISVKRLAQIIRRMLPDIKELRYLLPQLKDGLFAEGMSPADYLSLVKELSKELDSDELMQVMIEASEQVGLSLHELIEGIKDAPEEAARLIVLTAEIKKGGVRADEQQLSEVLSDYIEKVSRALALQSPEAAGPSGGMLLKTAVSRIEREIIERLKQQNVGLQTVSAVAEKLANQFTDTVSLLKGDWVRTNINRSKGPSEETLLAIIEQIAESGMQNDGVTDNIREIMISGGYTAEAIDTVVQKARLRAASAVTHALELPQHVLDADDTMFFIDLEIKRSLRYNSPFSTIIISYDNIVDLRTFSLITLTPDINIQLTNQSLALLKKMQREIDIVGIYTINNISVPILILPMTDMTGALYVKKRIEKELPCHEFALDDITVHIEPKASTLSFNKKITFDLDSYMEAMYQIYCQPRAR